MTKYINYTMIVFAFVFPISIAGANLLLLIMLILWIAEKDFKHKIDLLAKEKIIIIFYSIALLTLLSALLSNSYTDSFLARPNKSLFKVILSHYFWIPFVLVIFITSIKQKYLTLIISAFLASIFISEMVSYLIFFELIDITYYKGLHLLYHMATPEKPTPFMHPISYSVFLTIAIMLLLDTFIKTEHKFVQLFVSLFLLSATVNLFMNESRTGQIAFILGTLTYIFFRFKTNFKPILLTLVILITIIFTAYHASPVFHKRVNFAITDMKKIFTGDYTTSWGLRSASNMVAINYLLSSPSRFIFGAGAGDAKKEWVTHASTHFPKRVSEPIAHLHHLHNQYLQYWFDGTFISFLLFIFYFYLLFRLPVNQEIKPLLYAIGIAIMFSLISSNLFFRYKTFILFMLITGYFTVLAREKKESPKKE